MKTFLIILFATIGMSASAQTQMDILTSATMWTEAGADKYYSYMKFTKTTFTQGQVFGDEEYVGTMPFYLSDAPDPVFDQAKVGRSTSGRYIVVDFPGDEFPMVFRIDNLDRHSLSLFYDSRGQNTPNMTAFTLYARQAEPAKNPTPVPLFTTMKSGNRNLITSGVDFSWPSTVWSTPTPDGQLPYTTDGDMPLKTIVGSVDMSFYANTSNIQGYDMITVRNASAEATYKSFDKFSTLSYFDVNPGTKIFAEASSNGCFVEVPCANCTLVMALGVENRRLMQNRLVIFALTNDDVKIVYDKFVRVVSIKCGERGKFNLLLSNGRIYEENDVVYLLE